MIGAVLAEADREPSDAEIASTGRLTVRPRSLMAIDPGRLNEPSTETQTYATPTPTNQNNYTFQTVQDWPRNDQVARFDWNVARDTTFYSRVQFGYEKRAGGVSLLGSTGAGWPQQPSKYEIDTVSYVNTLLRFLREREPEIRLATYHARQATAARAMGIALYDFDAVS